MNLWKINPEWVDTKEGFIEEIKGSTAGLVIGDRTFTLNGKFSYEYDLAEEWFRLTALPFVFAAWVANKDLPVNFLLAFNEALRNGVQHRQWAVEHWQNSAPHNADLQHYFDHCISFEMDEEKKKAMDLFYRLSSETTSVSTNKT